MLSFANRRGIPSKDSIQPRLIRDGRGIGIGDREQRLGFADQDQAAKPVGPVGLVPCAFVGSRQLFGNDRARSLQCVAGGCGLAKLMIGHGLQGERHRRDMRAGVSGELEELVQTFLRSFMVPRSIVGQGSCDDVPRGRVAIRCVCEGAFDHDGDRSEVGLGGRGQQQCLAKLFEPVTRSSGRVPEPCLHLSACCAVSREVTEMHFERGKVEVVAKACGIGGDELSQDHRDIRPVPPGDVVAQLLVEMRTRVRRFFPGQAL